MLSLIRLFLYPLSSDSNLAVSVLFAFSVASIQASSRCASGSPGAASRIQSHASLYRRTSDPFLASATAAFNASTQSGTQVLPTSNSRSYRVRPVSIEQPLVRGIGS